MYFLVVLSHIANIHTVFLIVFWSYHITKVPYILRKQTISKVSAHALPHVQCGDFWRLTKTRICSRRSSSKSGNTILSKRRFHFVLERPLCTFWSPDHSTLTSFRGLVCENVSPSSLDLVSVMHCHDNRGWVQGNFRATFFYNSTAA